MAVSAARFRPGLAGKPKQGRSQFTLLISSEVPSQQVASVPANISSGSSTGPSFRGTSQ